MAAPSPSVIPAAVALDTQVSMPQEPPVFGIKISHSSLSSCWHYRCSCWHYSPPTCGLHNYCTQNLHYTHVHRKKIRNKVNKKFDQTKLLKYRMWLEKCSDHILLIFKQPAFYPLSLYFPHSFSLPCCVNPSLSLPFVPSPIIPYCDLCNLCICPTHPGSITPSAGRTLHSWLIMMGFRPVKLGWVSSGTVMRGAWTGYPFVWIHNGFLPPTVNPCASQLLEMALLWPDGSSDGHESS